jgi:succinate dehydrogenase cytochrome b556 subunit
MAADTTNSNRRARCAWSTPPVPPADRGVVSILHRASGMLMFFLLPFVVWLFDVSLTSEISYGRFTAVFAAGAGFVPGWFFKLVALALIWSYLHHFIAGVRHLWMDATPFGRPGVRPPVGRVHDRREPAADARARRQAVLLLTSHPWQLPTVPSASRRRRALRHSSDLACAQRISAGRDGVFTLRGCRGCSSCCPRTRATSAGERLKDGRRRSSRLLQRATTSGPALFLVAVDEAAHPSS